MNEKISKYIFFLIAALEIVSQFEFFPFQFIHNITKPMLMPALALFFYFQTKNTFISISKYLVYLALFFAWLGDVFLMLVNKNPIYFMMGLGSFLVMQILFIKIFNLFSINGLKIKIGYSVSITLLGVLVFAFLFPKLDGLKIPVFLYFLAILTMVLSALDLWNKTKFGKEVFFGAVLFMISDIIIAINKFKMEVPLAGFLIMITYIMAQWYIVNGLTKKAS